MAIIEQARQSNINSTEKPQGKFLSRFSYFVHNNTRRLNTSFFLASELSEALSISTYQECLKKMFGKDPSECMIVVIPTGHIGDLEPPPEFGEPVTDAKWKDVIPIQSSIDAFKSIGYNVKILNFEGKSIEQLKKEILVEGRLPDGLFLLGGNTFFYTEIVFTDFIRKLIRKIKVIGGSSAGPVYIAGKDLKAIEYLDNKDDVRRPEREKNTIVYTNEGLGLLDATILPHVGLEPEDEPSYDKAKEVCKRRGTKYIPLTNKKVITGKRTFFQSKIHNIKILNPPD